MTSSNMKLKYAIVALGALVLAGCSSPEEKAKSYYASGAALLESGDYARASVEFRNALAIKKDYAEAWFGMAQIEEHSQDWSRMVGDLNKVIELDDKHIRAHQSLAKFYLVAGNLPAALKAVNAALEKSTDSSDILALRGAILLKLDDVQGAQRDIDKAMKIEPTHAEATVVEATLRLARKDFSGALDVINKSIAKNSKTIGLFLIKLKIAEQMNDLSAQEATIRTIVTTFPDNKQFKKGLRSFLVKIGRSDEAEKDLRDALATNPDDKDSGLALFDLVNRKSGIAAARDLLSQLAEKTSAPADYIMMMADVDYATNKKESAYRLLTDLINDTKISDQGIAARLNLASKYIADKQLDNANTLVDEVLKNDTLNTSALKLRGAINIQKGDLDAAIEVLRQAANNGADINIRLMLADIYERKSSNELAMKELLETFRQSNGDFSIGLVLSKYYVRHGETDKAEDLLTQLVSQNSTANEAVSLLANLKLQKQDWKGAEDLAKMVKANGGDAKVSDEILGESLIGQQKFDDAITLLKTSVSSAPESVRPMYALVRSYLGAGKTDLAREFVESVVKASPNNSAANILLGMVLIAEDKPVEAQKQFERAVEVEPTQPGGYMALSKFYFDQKNPEKSIAAIRTGLDKVKDNANMRMALGAIYETTGQPEASIEQYQAVVNDNPNAVVAVNNLVSVASDNVKDPEKLKYFAELAKPLKDSPIPQFRESYGWMLVQMGDVKTGVNILQQTIGKLDKYGAAHYHLGLAYMKNNNLADADRELQKAINLETDPYIMEKIVKAISELKAMQK